MQFGILGPLEVLEGGRPVAVQRRKHRALLAVLLLHAGEVVSTERLVEELWGEDPPRTARDALQNYVSLLRKTLGADVLTTRDSGYVLDVRPEQIDAARFESLAAEARSASGATERAGKLREGLELWRGPALADLAYEPFAAIETARLEELRLAASEDLIDAELELGRHADLVPELETLIQEHPFDERLRGQLMLALYRGGRQAEALEAYQAARHVLVDELGLEPGPPLRELEQAILRHDPVLGAARPAPVAASRRTVTVLFAGVADAVERDPEAVGERLERVRAAVVRHGGTPSFVGDAAMAVFGVPQAHEDDALRAIRTAVELRQALQGLRIGIGTGEVFAGGEVVTGAPITLARQLEQAAPAGEILVGASTLRLVRDAVRSRRSKRRGVPAFRIDELIEGAPAVARRLEAPLVGRERELADARSAFEAARDGQRCLVFTVLGEAGIGKSRLARELISSLGDEASLLVGRCVSYGDGATYLPLRDMLGDDFVSVVEAAGSTGEVFLAVRRRFEELAASQPLLLAFDDLHWAEPTLLDLIEYLGAQATGPILVLCLARPDLLEARPGWSEAGTSLVLEPLPDDQARELLGSLADPGVAERIVETAEGNPLYVEQLRAYVEEEGADALDAVPGTIEALLASRLDRLGPAERRVAQRAAVVGRRFSLGAVAALGPAEALVGLEQAGLVHRRASGDYRFHHVLVRDVAYAGAPKAERAELHQLHADWLDGQPEGSDELIGYHLEEAALYRRDLGAPEQQVERLATNAGRRLGTAGIRAWKRGDARATANLLRRATALLPERDPHALELRCELGEALQTAGDLSGVEAVLVDAREKAVAESNRRVELRAHLALLNLQVYRTETATADDLLEAATTAIPVLAAHGDDRALGRAWYYAASVHGAYHCRYAEAERAARQALIHYRKAGWPVAACLNILAASVYHGPTPVPKAISECELLLADADVNGQANVLAHLAGLRAMQGDFGRAREELLEARSLFMEIGQNAGAEYLCREIEVEIELLGGNEARAQEVLEASCATLGRIGNRAYLATRTALLADVLYRRGRLDEAERHARDARLHSSRDDVPTQWIACTVEAKVLARRGKLDEAEQLARQAVTMLEATDVLNRRAACLLDLAEVLSLAGRSAEAAVLIEGAVELYTLKENEVGAARARSIRTGTS